MRPHVCSCLMFAVAATAALAVGDADVSNVAAIQCIVPQLAGLTFPAGDPQIDSLVTAYHDVGAHVIGQCDRASLTADQRTYAYYLLGSLRVAEAAPILVENIEFRATSTDPKFSIGRWGSFPATDALKKIGRPAVTEILAKAARPQSASRLEQMAIVVESYFGRTLAASAVQEAVDVAEDETAKGNLSALLRAVKGRRNG